MRVLVLGATGFLGGAIARAAVEAGAAVRGMQRGPLSKSAVADLEAIEWVKGDVSDPESLVRAMKGREVVFHAAGYYPAVMLDRAGVLDRGVTGMRNVLAAAQEAGVSRVVYTSSLATIGKAPDGKLANEDDWYMPGSVTEPYWDLKWAMEQECFRAVASGLDVVVTNPTMCFGPGDVKPTSGVAILHVVRGWLPVYADGAWNVVDARDVAAAHLVAAKRGKSGRRYILGGHNITVSMFFHHVAKAAGVQPPQILVPDALVRGAAWASEMMALVTRKPPMLPIEGVDMIRFGQHFDCSRARNELDLVTRPVEETVRDALAWFRAHGHLQP